MRRMVAREGSRMMIQIWVLLACIWGFNPSSVNGDTSPNDVTALNNLYTSLNSPGQLNGWQASGGDPCGQSWKGVTCSGSSVTAIKLSGMGLSGTLGFQLNSLSSTKEIDLSSNNIGSSIGYNLPTTLERLNLAGNAFNGSIPYLISQMTSLQYLNLAHNQLQDLQVDFGQLTNLSTMDVSNNVISGSLPDSMKSLSSLTTLYLNNNQFTGTIDVLASLPLDNLNVGNNQFTGWIPDQLKKINSLQTDGNSWNSGPAPPPPPYTPPPSGRRINPGQGSGGSKSPSDGSGGGKKSGIGGGGVAGIIISLVVIGAIVAFFLVKRKKRKAATEATHDPDQTFTPLASSEVKVDKFEMKPVQVPSAINTTVFQPPAVINLKPPPTDRNRSYDEDDVSNKPIVVKKSSKDPIRATVYSVADLQIATNSFSPDNLVGEGSIGRVYRAQSNDGKVLAVKKINYSALPNQSTEAFIETVSNISRLHHPNLSELVGYCSEHGQHLLVYEFHKNGSLHDLLHIADEYTKPLTWNTRVKIALGTARALEYLHEVCSPSLVHKNFKSANILLDNELNPRLSDCGLANLIPNAEYQASDNNNAPEVAMSGQYTMKSDVYSFGVVMLELLTGRMPFDSSKPRSEQSLVRWATPQLHDIDALDKMVDPALEGLYPAKSLSRFADVVALCVQTEPEFRPPMSEVVQALVRLVQRANMSKRVIGGDGADAAL